MCVYIYIYIYIYIYVCVCVCINIYICVCVCVYLHNIYISMYIHIGFTLSQLRLTTEALSPIIAGVLSTPAARRPRYRR